MDYVRLGKSGLKVSRICLGTMTYGDPKWRDWVLGEEESRPFVQRALELGVNFFDTADMYSVGRSEEVVGRALRDFARREEVVIATKVFNPMGKGPNDRGLSRKHIMDAVHASLKRLGTDYIDLYQIHRFDPETPLEETLQALHDLVRLGMVRYIGASSGLAYQFAKSLYLADLHGWTRFVSMQNHYNLVYREEEREMMPLCCEEGVGVIPWSPIARGFLAGNRKGGEAQTVRARSDAFGERLYRTEGDYQIAERTVQVAQQLDVSSAQVAIAWLLQQEGVSAPIVGASKMHHLDEAVDALSVRLSDENRRFLEEPYQPHPVLGI
ncbi:aldo/keto reductase [Deinococcus peraridilitoris]|uniref:Putative oxidoreductase, aryl-alcohol dehydrogenase like protein n=1 Tax=Deinococcus peraridilitoris (strain DSM 19664 / LMG 22246 / CIP 109416 / KR-200) TaxID=937777 RepID=K9ZXU3_DEIPD|nr:aldo/keto reductase [Deinococcus peraridilitoris]AFZ66014.1 putative oxidoreductase, aryl-alcohol dehydrogenase like protein [Deinococcus peraridilitoris DSM 19664]